MQIVRGFCGETAWLVNQEWDDGLLGAGLMLCCRRAIDGSPTTAGLVPVEVPRGELERPLEETPARCALHVVDVGAICRARFRCEFTLATFFSIPEVLWELVYRVSLCDSGRVVYELTLPSWASNRRESDVRDHDKTAAHCFEIRSTDFLP